MELMNSNTAGTTIGTSRDKFIEQERARQESMKDTKEKPKKDKTSKKSKKYKTIKKRLDKKAFKKRPKAKLGKKVSARKAVVDKGGEYSFFSSSPNSSENNNKVGNNSIFKRSYDTEKEEAKKWLLK